MDYNNQRNIIIKLIFTSFLFFSMIYWAFSIHSKFINYVKNQPEYSKLSDENYSLQNRCDEKVFQIITPYCTTKYAIDTKDCGVCEKIRGGEINYSFNKSNCFLQCAVLTNQEKYCQFVDHINQVECNIYLGEIAKANKLLLFHLSVTAFLFTMIIFQAFTQGIFLKRLLLFGNIYIIIIGIGSLIIGIQGVYQDAAAPIMLFGLFGIIVAPLLFSLIISIIIFIIKKYRIN